MAAPLHNGDGCHAKHLLQKQWASTDGTPAPCARRSKITAENARKMQRCSSLVILPCSMRTIPFTVPTAGSPLSAPIGGPMARVHDDSGSTGSTSEPSSPSLCSVRGSTDNLATSYPSDFRGKMRLCVFI